MRPESKARRRVNQYTPIFGEAKVVTYGEHMYLEHRRTRKTIDPSYYSARWYDSNGKRTLKVRARKVMMLAMGTPVPAGMQVVRTCGYGPCVNPAHMTLMTRSQARSYTVARARKCGFRSDGEWNGRAKLSYESVDGIRDAICLANDARSLACLVSELSARYSVRKQVIRDVLAGRTWTKCDARQLRATAQLWYQLTGSRITRVGNLRSTRQDTEQADGESKYEHISRVLDSQIANEPGTGTA